MPAHTPSPHPHEVPARDATAPVGPDLSDAASPGPTEVAPALEVSKRPNPVERLVNVWHYRELLGNLTRKELKVKYKNSVLGFVWTLLNPALYLVVFSLVFAEVLQVKVPYYAIFFLSGLLVWNFFATGPQRRHRLHHRQRPAGAEGVVPPRDPAAGLHRGRHRALLPPGHGAGRRPGDLPPGAVAAVRCPRSLLAIVVLLILASALAIALGAINVYLRDTEHLLELALLAWFWLSCIVYPYRLVAERLGPSREWWAALNPVIPIIVTFQRVLYNPEDTNFGWYTNPRADGTASPDVNSTIPDRRPGAPLPPARLVPDPPGRRRGRAPCSSSWAPSGSSAGSRTTWPRRSDRAVPPPAIAIDSVSKVFKLAKDKPKSAKERVIRAGRIDWEASTPSPTSPSRSPRARPWPCSATTAAASRPCSSASPAPCGPPRAPSPPGVAWPPCSSWAPASTRTSPAGRTST